MKEVGHTMKSAMRASMLLSCWLLISVVSAEEAFSQTTVYTPEGAPVTAWVFSEFSPDDITYYNSVGDSLVIFYSLNAVRIGNASNVYNCHGYAWCKSEGGATVWIGAYGWEGCDLSQLITFCPVPFFSVGASRLGGATAAEALLTPSL
jgi:hypothetical protein